MIEFDSAIGYNPDNETYTGRSQCRECGALFTNELTAIFAATRDLLAREAEHRKECPNRKADQ